MGTYTSSEATLNNPVLLLRKLRNLIFGTNRPPFWMRLCCYVNLLIWLIFTLWHCISYGVISARALLLTTKEVDVEQLIFDRGEKLGFEPWDFLERLLQYHAFAVACWLLILLGIILCWRQKTYFIYVLAGGAALYYLVLFWNMGFRYYHEDTTWFDKISYAILLFNALIMYLSMRFSARDRPAQFWMEDEV